MSTYAKRYYDHVVVDTPIKPDALEYINLLHEQGHKIIIITARNEDLYTDPYKTTREELEKNNIKYDKLICTMDKAQACLDEQVELFINDSIKNCQSVKTVGIRTLLFESKANIAELVDLPRVRNWKDVYEIIR